MSKADLVRVSLLDLFRDEAISVEGPELCSAAIHSLINEYVAFIYNQVKKPQYYHLLYLVSSPKVSYAPKPCLHP